MADKSALVVEDEVDIAELIRYNLEMNEFKVDLAHSGEDGLKAAQEQHPDIVVLDIMLPGRSGLEICEALKSEKETEDIPIIMVSARGEEDDIVKGLELGADDYVTKPFSPKV